MTVGALAEFEPLYTRMGELGWAPAEVDAMEVWQVARFMGHDDEGFDPVIRGSRGLALPKDGGGDGDGPVKSKLARMAAKMTGRSSTVFRGEAAK